VTDWKKLDDRTLADAIATARRTIADNKAGLADMEAELSRRHADTAADILAKAGKDTGTLTFAFNGMRFKAEVAKKIEWDSDKLKAIAAGMPWNQVERLFDIKFSVPERIYNAIHSPEMVATLNAARTTRVGELKVSFVGFDV
jgi:DNA invertase Pin-like site-specific DNA recombinase